MPGQDLIPFLDARQNQLQLEVAAGDAIDTKALSVLASNIAVLIFIGQSTLDLHSPAVMALVMAFSGSLLLTMIAIWPRHYAGASVNMFDHSEYFDFSSTKLVKQLIADTEEAIFRNRHINERRWFICATSLIITAFASFTLFLMLYLR